MITFDLETRQFSVSNRGMGRALLIGGVRSGIGTWGSGRLYDLYKKQGLSDKEAREKAILHSTGATAAGSALGHAIVRVPQILGTKNKVVRNRLINKSINDAVRDVTKVSIGTAIGAEKRTRSKIYKNAVNK